jgi:hypothetical protein
MSEFKLSTYQQAIVDEYKNGTENLFINAFAGSAKTTMLIELSKHTDKYSVFLAFNKSIQEELKERIKNPKFKTYTFNGLGYMIMNHNWDKMEEERLKKNIAPSHKRNLILEQYKSRQNASQVMKIFKDKIGLDESDENYITMMYDIATLYDLCRQRLVNLSSEEDLLDTIEFYDLFNDVWIPLNIVEIMEQMLELDKIQFFNDGIIDFTDQLILHILWLFLNNGKWKCFILLKIFIVMNHKICLDFNNYL